LIHFLSARSTPISHDGRALYSRTTILAVERTRAKASKRGNERRKAATMKDERMIIQVE
jgi:hypothetical protein